jgi:hypothetical protein
MFPQQAAETAFRRALRDEKIGFSRQPATVMASSLRFYAAH